MSEYPKWIKATVPGVGEVDMVADSKAEEDAARAGTAVFKLMQAAPESGGVKYTIELPQAEARRAEEAKVEPVPEKPKAEPVKPKAKPPVQPKHVKSKRR